MSDSARIHPAQKPAPAAAPPAEETQQRVFLVSGRLCFELTPQTKTIGRSFSADYILLDGSVSRKHAELQLVDGLVRVRDLDSRNGTFVANQRIACCDLPMGANVRFGKIDFRIEDDDSTIGSMSSEAVPIPQIHPDRPFSPAQQRVLHCLLNGLSEKEAARALGISHHTVHNHVKDIYALAGVSSRAELMAKLLRRITH